MAAICGLIAPIGCSDVDPPGSVDEADRVPGDQRQDDTGDEGAARIGDAVRADSREVGERVVEFGDLAQPRHRDRRQAVALAESVIEVRKRSLEGVGMWGSASSVHHRPDDSGQPLAP
jgi:hypothetical protein